MTPDRRVIRNGLCAMHWIWTGILLQPSDVLLSSPAYRPFLRLMPLSGWVVASLSVAIIATLGVLIPGGRMRHAAAFLQALWLLLLEVLFSSHYPVQTGCAPYMVAAGFALWLAFTEEEHQPHSF